MSYDGIIDVIKQGVECMLIAAFIIFAMYIIHVRDNYADTTNNMMMTDEVTQNDLEFSMYNTGKRLNVADEWLTADEVIACFRKYKNGDTEVYLDKDKNDQPLFLNIDTVTADNQRAPGTPSKFSVTKLMETVDNRYYYHPFLLYDGVTVDQVDFKQYDNTGYAVTGIVFIKTNTVKVDKEITPGIGGGTGN